MKIFLLLLLLVMIILFVISRYLSLAVVAEFLPGGKFRTIDGVSLHYTDWPAGPNADLLPMVFLHGASGNLRDLQAPLAEKLQGRGRMIFLDRPGLGYSGRGNGEDIHLPSGKAKLVSGLLGALGIEKAIIVGHSLGASTAAAFAVNHPRQTAGLVFLAPATHPWPGAAVTWYYDVVNTPVLGWLFSELVAIPAGHLLFNKTLKNVFKPNPVPAHYRQQSGARLVLRPKVFRNNAKDVGSLYGAVTKIAPSYRQINVPTSIISGDADDIVLADIHSAGLARDIKGAKLVWLKDTGHMPAWTHPDVVISQIERVSAEADK